MQKLIQFEVTHRNMKRLLINNGNALVVGNKALIIETPIIWNQQFEISKHNDSTTVNGVTFTWIGNTLKLSGVASENITLLNYFWWNKEEKNHKYFVNRTLVDKLSINSNVYNGISLNNISTFQTGGTKNAAYADGQAFIIKIKANTDFGEESLLQIDIFDLTRMFGEGNEPTTIKNFQELIYLGEVVQLVKNGNFSEGKTQWLIKNGGWTIENETAIVTKAGGSSGMGGIIYQNGPFYSSHKYYLKAQLASPNVSTCFAFHASGGTVSGNTMVTTSETNLTLVDDVLSPVRDTCIIAIRAGSSASGMNSYGIADNVNCIDLTEMFGSGKEPSIYSCRILFAKNYYKYYNSN